MDSKRRTSRKSADGGASSPDHAAKVRRAVEEGLGLKGQAAEVAILLALGLNEEDIAQRLCIEPSTVHDHVKRAHKVLGVHSRQELLALIIGKIVEFP